MSALGNIPVILEGPDPLRLAGAVVNVDLRKVEPLCVNVHERGGASPVVGATPVLAEGITGVEPTSEAEKAITAEPKALAPWAQDEARRGHEVDVQPHEALLQKGKCKAEALSQERELGRRPNEGERKSVWRPREMPRQDEGALETPPQNHERKHAYEPPPEVLPRKGEHNIEMPSTGKGKHTEAFPQDSGSTPKALPPEHELGVDALPQGSPKEGKSERDTPP